ncbi:hypothetical protein HDV57DRAFT_202603 [Trichoderma longibrachiatum]|uniref:Uncharacterized protein n=1 Tax=Trichoderma longibrachiatum ATCC 18648 TaxID=983965 RepID=A0A2T4C872_TRILO|nr:hypothetical protein M440DRAFT_1223240 [Trichoderma longibrachiatum ATCC 18648]
MGLQLRRRTSLCVCACGVKELVCSWPESSLSVPHIITTSSREFLGYRAWERQRGNRRRLSPDPRLVLLSCSEARPLRPPAPPRCSGIAMFGRW